MRKFFLLTLLLFSSLLRAQAPDSLKYVSHKKYSNELGLDATPFFKYYTTFNSNGYNLPINYYLTYRHYFKKGNLRSAVGGNYSNAETPSPYNSDTLQRVYRSKQFDLEFRLGYEFFQNLSKRWQVFYGADIRTNYAYDKRDDNFSNGGYANGSESVYNAIGIAPILGIRFKVHKRINLLTESNILLQYSKNSTHRYYIPANNSYPTKPDDPKTTTKTINTVFSYPVSIILTISI